MGVVHGLRGRSYQLVRKVIVILQKSRWRRILTVVAVVAVLAGCTPHWEIALLPDDQAAGCIRAESFRTWQERFPGEVAGNDALLLERALWESGISAIDRIYVDGRSYAWDDVHDDSWLLPSGEILLGETLIAVDTLVIESPVEGDTVAASITDIAPTVAGALGVRSPNKSGGRALTTATARHVVYLFLDGLGYRRYQETRDQGVMPFLDSLGPPLTALTVYPSVTKVASAAMLTGAMPKENGVRDTSQRKTDVETILDVLSAEGRSCIAVEGDGLAFNMPNAEVILSGDRDGNGGSDDNTFHNASQVIRERMPDFLWVHFHGIDDVGHSHGPGSDQELTKMREVDGYVRDIVAALPSDTLVIIASDHGMHRVHDQARKGNHGSLTARDMFVPLWLLETPHLASPQG